MYKLLLIMHGRVLVPNQKHNMLLRRAFSDSKVGKLGDI